MMAAAPPVRRRGFGLDFDRVDNTSVVSHKSVHKSVEPCLGSYLLSPSKQRAGGHGCGGLSSHEWPAPVGAVSEGAAPKAPLRELGKETLQLIEPAGTGGSEVQ